MAANRPPSYKRAPSLRLQQHLGPDGFLAPLLLPRRVAGIDLETHLRSGDEVHLYCGLTCLVKAKLSRSGDVWIESHKTYADNAYAKLLFRPGRSSTANRGAYFRGVWAAGEPGFVPALSTFLGCVERDGPRRLDRDWERWTPIVGQVGS